MSLSQLTDQINKVKSTFTFFIKF